MPDKKQILFIVNPISGVGSQKNIGNIIETSINKDIYNYTIAYTDYAGHATELAKKAAEHGIDIIVAVGGDGSVNEVARGLIHTSSIMGMIPTGSGNGLARHLKIPFNFQKAIEIINRAKFQLIDTATINGELFVSIAGIGFDALVAQKFSHYKHRGFITYAKVTVSEYFLYSQKKFIMYIDGERLKKKAFFVSIANAGQFGYNAIIAPGALLNDGYVDICILKKVPFYAAPFVLWKLFNRNIDTSKYLEIIKAKEIRIIKNITHNIHIDGDSVHASNELIIKVIPLSLRIIVP